MVRNACLNYLKHLQLVEQHNLEHLDRVVGQEELYYWDFNLSPEYTLLYKELQQQISLVMSDLPSRCREVFEMSRFKKMKTGRSQMLSKYRLLQWKTYSQSLSTLFRTF